MNVARWSPSHALEREAAEEARLAARARLRVRVALAATALAAPLTCFALSSRPEFFPIGLAYTMGAFWSLKRALRQQESWAWERDAAAIDEFGGRDGWSVQLMVRQGEAPTGEDRGMMWIEGDRLYFAGRRTSFGLTADQASGDCRFDSAVRGHQHELLLPLAAWTAAGQVAVSFAPVVHAKWQDRGAVYDLREAVDRWRARGGAEGGQLPPIVPGPGAPSAQVLLRRAVWAGTIWIAYGVGVVGLVGAGLAAAALPCAMAGGLIGAVWGDAWSPFARYRAYQDRRRLDPRQFWL